VRAVRASGRSSLPELSDLGDARASELREIWAEVFGTSAPPSLSGRLMRLALVWEAQAASKSGEDPSFRRAWSAIEKRRGAGASAKEAVDGVVVGSAPAGTRLLKHWGGETHEVVVTTEGALWNGRAYSSLSAVARAMTGTRRNGPRFFGLRGEGRP
jgi:hypothetical protein